MNWYMGRTLDEIVRDNIRLYREAAGLSMHDLAKRSKLSVSTISRIELGKNAGGRTAGLEVLDKIATGLGIIPELLLMRHPTDHQQVIEYCRLTSALTDEDKAQVLEFAKFKVAVRETGEQGQSMKVRSARG